MLVDLSVDAVQSDEVDVPFVSMTECYVHRVWILSVGDSAGFSVVVSLVAGSSWSGSGEATGVRSASGEASGALVDVAGDFSSAGGATGLRFAVPR